MPRLSAKSLKCTVVLDAGEVSAIPDIGTPRIVLSIVVADVGVITTDIAAKSLRKAQALIGEHGTDGVACIIQGKLAAGGKVVEAGLVGQVKAPKPVVADAAA